MCSKEDHTVYRLLQEKTSNITLVLKYIDSVKQRNTQTLIREVVEQKIQ